MAPVDRRSLLRGGLIAAGGAAATAVGMNAHRWLGPDRLPIGGGYAATADMPDWLRGGQVSTIWYVPTDERVVALTFDDGPAPRWTPMVLDLLDDVAAPATFFMVGRNLRAYRSLVAGRLDRHDVGNHTWTHADLAELDPDGVRAQITRTHGEIVDAIGREPSLLRPPWGHIAGSTLLAANALRYRLVLWSQEMQPALFAHDGAGQADDIARNARPGGIILAHDVGAANRLAGLRHVADIVTGLRARGFRLVTVSEMVALAGI